MYEIKNLYEIRGKLDIDLQLIASEFDTSLKQLFYIDISDVRFKNFIIDLRNLYFEMSYDENLDLCHIENVRIILFENLFDVFIIFEYDKINFIKNKLQL